MEQNCRIACHISTDDLLRLYPSAFRKAPFPRINPLTILLQIVADLPGVDLNS